MGRILWYAFDSKLHVYIYNERKFAQKFYIAFEKKGKKNPKLADSERHQKNRPRDRGRASKAVILETATGVTWTPKTRRDD